MGSFNIFSLFLLPKKVSMWVPTQHLYQYSFVEKPIRVLDVPFNPLSNVASALRKSEFVREDTIVRIQGITQFGTQLRSGFTSDFLSSNRENDWARCDSACIRVQEIEAVVVDCLRGLRSAILTGGTISCTKFYFGGFRWNRFWEGGPIVGQKWAIVRLKDMMLYGLLMWASLELVIVEEELGILNFFSSIPFQNVFFS